MKSNNSDQILPKFSINALKICANPAWRLHSLTLRSWRKTYMVPLQTCLQWTKDLFWTKSFPHIMEPEAIFGLICTAALKICANAAWRLHSLSEVLHSSFEGLYKSLKFTHVRGKYAKRTIIESTVAEARFLHLVLCSADRAWSHAMEKRQLPDGTNACQRIYLIGRLRKAVFKIMCSYGRF
ncbi:uncharacterized protein LOC133290349 isoform X2 [Gastrolobium bilobum]|uniref:uncharacterized protein LOC133290349 isoform X2 n=1 Tax=Gastrolobium bilobum TaxID=150636 RepID=UPI002AB154AE|nr:uncharacterized protein LOC133290349 isoform X2 [Gastrolobium bilobum]